MKTLKFAAMILAVLALNSCSDKDETKPVDNSPGYIGLSSESHAILSSGTDFSFNFFKQVSNEFPDNLFVSPYSLGMALGMLYNGAEDETKEEIAAAMEMSGYTPEQVNGYYKTLTEGLLSVDSNTKLSVANAIWSDKNFPCSIWCDA